MGESAGQRTWVVIVHLIEETPAALALDAACQKWQQAGFSWECATWVVLRDKYLGDPVTESGRILAFTFEGARSKDMPTVTIIFERQGDAIVIHDARFTEAKYGQAGSA